ncbi:unnamed protein product, partial [Amoebophrya sp. A25]
SPRQKAASFLAPTPPEIPWAHFQRLVPASVEADAGVDVRAVVNQANNYRVTSGTTSTKESGGDPPVSSSTSRGSTAASSSRTLGSSEEGVTQAFCSELLVYLRSIFTPVLVAAPPSSSSTTTSFSLDPLVNVLLSFAVFPAFAHYLLHCVIAKKTRFLDHADGLLRGAQQIIADVYRGKEPEEHFSTTNLGSGACNTTSSASKEWTAQGIFFLIMEAVFHFLTRLSLMRRMDLQVGTQPQNQGAAVRSTSSGASSDEETVKTEQLRAQAFDDMLALAAEMHKCKEQNIASTASNPSISSPTPSSSLPTTASTFYLSTILPRFRCYLQNDTAIDQVLKAVRDTFPTGNFPPPEALHQDGEIDFDLSPQKNAVGTRSGSLTVVPPSRSRSRDRYVFAPAVASSKDLPPSVQQQRLQDFIRIVRRFLEALFFELPKLRDQHLHLHLPKNNVANAVVDEPMKPASRRSASFHLRKSRMQSPTDARGGLLLLGASSASSLESSSSALVRNARFSQALFPLYEEIAALVDANLTSGGLWTVAGWNVNVYKTDDMTKNKKPITELKAGDRLRFLKWSSNVEGFMNDVDLIRHLRTNPKWGNTSTSGFSPVRSRMKKTSGSSRVGGEDDRDVDRMSVASTSSTRTGTTEVSGNGSIGLVSASSTPSDVQLSSYTGAGSSIRPATSTKIPTGATNDPSLFSSPAATCPSPSVVPEDVAGKSDAFPPPPPPPLPPPGGSPFIASSSSLSSAPAQLAVLEQRREQLLGMLQCLPFARIVSVDQGVVGWIRVAEFVSSIDGASAFQRNTDKIRLQLQVRDEHLFEHHNPGLLSNNSNFVGGGSAEQGTSSSTAGASDLQQSSGIGSSTRDDSNCSTTGTPVTSSSSGNKKLPSSTST